MARQPYGGDTFPTVDVRESWDELHGQDPEFYGFLRRLESYEKIFADGTTVVLRPDSDLLRYLHGPGAP